MKLALSIVFTLILSIGYAQGLQESFDASCNCWTVTNHFDNGQVSSEHTENAARKKNGTATTYNANGIIIRQENWKWRIWTSVLGGAQADWKVRGHQND